MNMNKCKICGSDKTTDYEIREMMFGSREIYSYYQCNNCGCLQKQYIPEDLSQYYPSNYYSFGKFIDDKRFKNNFRGKMNRYIYNYSSFNKNLYQKFLDTLITPFKYSSLVRKLALNYNHKILDFGCGNSADFLYTLQEIGFQNLIGFDPYIDEDFHYENGLSIYKKKIDEINDKFDFVFCHHVFEHLPEQSIYLEKLKSLLKKDGKLIIRIPTVDSYAWEYYRENWFQVDAPRHLFLHSVKSMKILTESMHLKISDVIYDSTYHQFYHSEEYKNDIPLNQSQHNGIYKYLTKKINKRKYLNQTKKLNKESRGDQAVFIIEKNEQ